MIQLDTINKGWELGDIPAFWQGSSHGRADVSDNTRIFPAHDSAFDRRKLHMERTTARDWALLGVLRDSLYVANWRDLPTCYGKWHSIYMRFKRGSGCGLWWHILMTL